MQFLNNKKLINSLLVVFAAIFFFVPLSHSVNASGLYCGVNINPLKPFTCQVAPEIPGDRSDCQGLKEGDACVPIDRAQRVTKAVAPSADTLGCAAGAAAGIFNPVAIPAAGVCLAAKITASLLEPVATLLDKMVQFNNNIFSVDFIKSLWTMVRNFVNLFFILIMIVIAFATIFDIQKYNWQKLLVRLIIVALLVNFSFLIVQTASNLSDQISNQILTQVNSSQGPDGKPHSISEWLAAGFNPQKFAVANKTWLASFMDIATSSIGTALGVNLPKNTVEIVFYGLMLLTLVTLVVMYLLRVFVLWGLAITAPAAFVAAILPNTREHFETWKKHLIAWTLFSPLYLLVIAVTIGFATHRNDIISSLHIDPSDSTSFLGLLGIGDVIFYALTLTILWFGLAAVRKVGHFANTGVNTAFEKIQGGIKSGAKNIGYAGYRFSGAKTRVEGATEGLKAKAEQIKEKGIFGGYLGAQRSRMTKAKYVEMFGLGATSGAKDKQITSEVAKSKEQYRAIKSEEELRARMNQESNDINKLALAERLKEEGALTPKESLDTYQNYQRIGAGLAAQQFAKGVDFGKDKMYPDERAAWEEATNDPIIRRKIELAKGEAGDYKNASPEMLAQIATIFGANRADQKEFLDKIAKNNFVAATQAKADLGLVMNAEGTRVATRDEAIIGELKKMNLDKVLELSPNSLKAMLENADAKKSIEDKLTPETIKGLAAKATEAQLKTLETVIASKKKIIEAEEDKKLQKQADAQAKGMKPFVDAIQDLANKINRP